MRSSSAPRNKARTLSAHPIMQSISQRVKKLNAGSSVRRFCICLFVALWSSLLACPVEAAASVPPALMRYPNSHGNQIVFEARGNLWVVSKAGGTAKRLTTGPGRDFAPRYSPGGRWIAYVGSYEGKQEVFIIPSTGGESRRLSNKASRGIVTAPPSRRVNPLPTPRTPPQVRSPNTLPNFSRLK